MSDSLLPYYERELDAIKRLAAEFADTHPKIAGRLRLSEDSVDDPHVARLLEGVAFLAARVHHRLDDEFPELTDALLGVLYPHYLAPIPSMAVVQFNLDAARVALPNGFLIDRHSRLHTHPLEYQPGKRLPCQFRTCYPVTLWPIAVTGATFQPPPFPSSFIAPESTKA